MLCLRLHCSIDHTAECIFKRISEAPLSVTICNWLMRWLIQNQNIIARILCIFFWISNRNACAWDDWRLMTVAGGDTNYFFSSSIFGVTATRVKMYKSNFWSRFLFLAASSIRLTWCVSFTRCCCSCKENGSIEAIENAWNCSWLGHQRPFDLACR